MVLVVVVQEEDVTPASIHEVGRKGGVSFGDDVGLEHQVMRHCAGHGFRVPW